MAPSSHVFPKSQLIRLHHPSGFAVHGMNHSATRAWPQRRDKVKVIVALGLMERETGIEPATFSLEGWRSTG